MTRAEVWDFVKSGICRLKPKNDYGRGRLSEMSSESGRQMIDLPFVWMETVEDQAHVNVELAPTTMLPLDGWPIRLHITKKSNPDASPEEYESIVDECDSVAQTLIFIYNTVVRDSTLITIGDIARSPFIKRHSDNTTGVLLTFIINAPDTTDQSDNCE